jgi:hypothetical protein
MSEVEAVEQLHRAAQARLGLAVALMSKDAFGAVQATNPATGGARWAEAMVQAVLVARELSALLAQSYYQLARALELGVTLGQVLNGRPATIGGLRDNFLEQAMSIASIGDDAEATPFHALYDGSIADGALRRIDILPEVQNFLDQADESQDSRPVRSDPFNWPTLKADDETAAAIRKQLMDEAITPYSDEVAKLRKQESERANTVARLEKAHAAKGQLGAGRADEQVMRAGRAILEHAQGRDRRVLKFARGTGSNPCAFCAMLASRGFVYASSQTADKTYRDGGLRSYHPNCHCFPIARWVDESPLPQQNAYFEQLWKTEIQNKFSGRAALRQWRKVLAQKRREGASTTTDE